MRALLKARAPSGGGRGQEELVCGLVNGQREVALMDGDINMLKAQPVQTSSRNSESCDCSSGVGGEARGRDGQ